MPGTLTEARSTRRPSRSSNSRPFTLTVNHEVPRLVLSQHILGAAGRRSSSTRVITIEGDKVVYLLPVLAELLHRSGFHPDRLELKARSVFRLEEADAARVGLLLKVVAPLQNVSRLRLARTGILDMSDEEVYYWYAKVASRNNGDRGGTALRALRLLLGGE